MKRQASFLHPKVVEFFYCMNMMLLDCNAVHHYSSECIFFVSPSGLKSNMGGRWHSPRCQSNLLHRLAELVFWSKQKCLSANLWIHDIIEKTE